MTFLNNSKRRQNNHLLLDRVLRKCFNGRWNKYFTPAIKVVYWISPSGFDDVHGGFGFWVRKGGGASLLGFTKAFELVIANSCFPKKEGHLVSFRSAVTKTQINYLLLGKGDRDLCKNCKVILGTLIPNISSWRWIWRLRGRGRRWPHLSCRGSNRVAWPLPELGRRGRG